MATKRKYMNREGGGERNNVPIVERLYRNNQESYVAAGGFMDDDDNVEERRQSFADAKQKKLGSTSVYVAAPDNCTRCNAALIDSYLWDKFHHPVCDACEKKDDENKLITRTEAKSKYLLKDCDLDMRQPILRFVSKKNPHNPRYGDMRLYLHAQIKQRALDVWTSWELLDEAKELRNTKRESKNEKAFEKKMKVLRDEVRGNGRRIEKRIAHEHTYGDEHFDSKSDDYYRICTSCQYRLSYDKL